MTEGGPIIRGRQRIAKNLDTQLVMVAGHTLHQMGRGMVAEIGRHIADTEPAVRRQAAGKLVGPLVQHLDLFKAQLGVAGCDTLSEMAKGKLFFEFYEVL